MQRAIAAYKATLVYRTPHSAPLDYARTQYNLGLVQEDLGDLSAAIICWGEAEKYYRRMGDIDNANMMLRWITAADKLLRQGDSPAES
ncbi:MAG: hypothetical protein ABI947_23700 [Chloroflexota bacterium]